ncbi:MAG: phytanoyl-CoA dioxygenase family protein [Acidocella sp.]|uniref:phytanoyl-CoA dioxygenase family protein n=1 Tax=Acidocella sp. TaxID=50710 RepID=UPI003FBF9B5B
MGIFDSISRLFSRQQSTATPVPPAIQYADFSEVPSDEDIPYIDHRVVDESKLTPAQREWRRDGVVMLRGFIPDEVTEAYIRRREALGKPPGWLIATPYMHIPEMRDLALYPPLMEKLQEVIGEPMMLHLCLTGWLSSQRGWHQDDYLNPSFVNSWYAAVWIALGDIHPDSGPFEYVPGSHRWPLMRGEKVRKFLTPEELTRREPKTGYNHWERYAERFVNPAIDYEVATWDRKPVKFLAKRGDVLIWHGRLIHRGSDPNVPGMERRSLIAHYSGINHRPDMPVRGQDQNGQNYAVFETSLID